MTQNHRPCPDCGSSDALTIYDDGHTFCFSCEKYTKANNLKSATFRAVDPDKFRDLKDRRIGKKTAEKFGVMSYPDPDPETHVYPYYHRDTKEHVANKIRLRDTKAFPWEGEHKNTGLFGQQVFPPGCSKRITLVEGECDAMAVYEMFETIKPGSNYPVVSVKNASTARKDVADNFEYLNSFDEIVICFDKDDPKPNPANPDKPRYPGQEAAQRVASMFEIGKCRVLTLEDYKDANDYLKAGQIKKFQKEWWAAPKFVPTGIKLGVDLWPEIANPPHYETIEYPFAGLNAKTYGLRLSELVIITAPPKIGKTSVLKHIEHHILHTTEEAGVGLLHLEESNRDTALGLMSIEAQKPLHLPDVWETVREDELRTYYDKVVNNERIVIWDHFGSNTIEEVLAVVRHMHNMGCKYIVLDHLSIVVSNQSGDERKQLDEITTKLKMLCMELNIAVIAVIHQNRAGEIRGTAGVEQLANMVFRLHRDKLDLDPWRRNVTKVEVTENRFCGRTGPACYLYYDEERGVLDELNEEEIKTYESGQSMEDFEKE